ncbi:unnamed protein product [Ambrosiozyma monospora]|uniref:Unnamed protein product n=1 Tax=Ambrosiozyma monospora TaxID=43982 RepID=A0A9W6TAQ6_AMBMO|nr:unnamed protein product [Ambrosiozyma monospora]
MFERKNQSVLSEHYLKLNVDNKTQEDDEEDFLSVKRKDHILQDDEIPQLEINSSKRSQKKALSRKLTAKSQGSGSKLVFDDDGIAHPIYELEDEEDFHKLGPADKLKEEFLNKERELMTKADSADKDVAREKKQEKKRRRKEMERLSNGYDEEEGDSEGEGRRQRR